MENFNGGIINIAFFDSGKILIACNEDEVSRRSKLHCTFFEASLRFENTKDILMFSRKLSMMLH